MDRLILTGHRTRVAMRHRGLFRCNLSEIRLVVKNQEPIYMRRIRRPKLPRYDLLFGRMIRNLQPIEKYGLGRVPESMDLCIDVPLMRDRPLMFELG